MGKRHVGVHTRKVQKKDFDRSREEENEFGSIFDSKEDLFKAVAAVLVILFMVLSALMVML